MSTGDNHPSSYDYWSMTAEAVRTAFDRAIKALDAKTPPSNSFERDMLMNELEMAASWANSAVSRWEAQ